MSVKYGKRKNKHGNIFQTISAVVLLCVLLLFMVGNFYSEAESEAHEILHLQTKQIKDNIVLQIKSDRENLVTMANFAAKLHNDGEDYNVMLKSFKPIGLFSEIGILNPDNTFITRAGTIDVSGKLSFEEEAARGEYISGRVQDITVKNKEVLRSAVPIVSNGKTIGVMYGIIPLELINQKYCAMAKEQDAQLFVYNKDTGKYIVDTFSEHPGALSELKTREFNEGYSYEQLITNDKGFSSFKSIRTGEDLFVHYSTIEDLNWGIILAKYETQVFAEVRKISGSILKTFFAMGLVVVIYLAVIFKKEKRNHVITNRASGIRKLLLDFNQQYNNVFEAMKNVQEASKSTTVFFADTDGEEYHYNAPGSEKNFPNNNDWKYFISEIFGYTSSIHSEKSEIGIAYINANTNLLNANPKLYDFMKKYGFKDVSFSIITTKRNRVNVLGTINSGKIHIARELLKDISACFSIAVYNRKHLNKTELAATTDSLTGALNRVAYKKDILAFDMEKPFDFSCIYVDVNELHIRNNKYGHAAGDEMLIYIANTLKEVFYGHHIYRMGGDEFLVFAEGVEQKQINSMIDSFVKALKPKGYNVAIGLSYRSQNTNCEEMVREAEVRMYSAKSQYYLNKEQGNLEKQSDQSYIQLKTGIAEIDTMLSVLKEHYNGIYRVSLSDDTARRILMPSYLGYKEEEKQFSKLVTKYIDDSVAPDYQRPVLNFLNYQAIKSQLSLGKIPRITFKKNDGETVVLSVYKLDENAKSVNETLWVFAKA